MARPKKTKLERLETALRRRAMTHKEIAKFLLGTSGDEYGPRTRTRYDRALYGSWSKPGFLSEKCHKTDDGKWKYGTTTFSAPAPW